MRMRLRRLVLVAVLVSLSASTIAAAVPSSPAQAAASSAAGTYSTDGHSHLRSSKALAATRSKQIAWRSGAGRRGAWVRWSTRSPVLVDSMRIVGAGPGTRMLTGVVRFSDGSRVMVRTDARGDATLRFRARSVRSAVLVVTKVRRPSARVALRRWTFSITKGVANTSAPRAAAMPPAAAAPGSPPGASPSGVPAEALRPVLGPGAAPIAPPAADQSTAETSTAVVVPRDVVIPDRPPVPVPAAPPSPVPTASASPVPLGPEASIDSMSAPALTDARSTLPASTGDSWTAPGSGAQDVLLTWAEPTALATLQLYGSPTAEGAVSAASATFGDGSTVRLLPVPAEAGSPTTVAFTPRTVRSVTIHLVPRTAAPVRLREIAAFAPGDLAVTRGAARGVQSPASAPARCGAATAASTTALRLVCPRTGQTLLPAATVVVSGPEGAIVRADAVLASGRTALVSTAAVVGGTAELGVDATLLPGGPISIRFTTPAAQGALTAQFINAVGAAPADPGTGPISGRTLVFDDEFDSPLAISATGKGSDYAATKPASWGGSEFGDAIFADPATHPENLGSIDGGWLRIRTTPLEDGAVDPAGWARTHRGGILSSASVNGGFAAQYGYFEARMLAPAAPGTWPAFWMMSDGFLVDSEGGQNSEVDAVELYGHDPGYSCHSWHDWLGVAQQQAGDSTCVDALADWSDTWHTYGVDIAADSTRYWVDGRLIRTAPAVRDAADPFYFMVDLSLGGGWPVDLSGTAGVTDLYVDHVRVYV